VREEVAGWLVDAEAGTGERATVPVEFAGIPGDSTSGSSSAPTGSASSQADGDPEAGQVSGVVERRRLRHSGPSRKPSACERVF